MIPSTNRRPRLAVVICLATLTAACGLPRSGPTKQEFLSSAVEREGNAFIVPVDDRVVRLTTLPTASGFSEAFRSAGVIPSDTISPGDVLSISIWENVDQGVLSGDQSRRTNLEQVQVDGQGFIFVPYAGRIRAAGDSPEALRQTITRQLETQTPDPQVLVTREAGDGATVSLIGKVGSQGVVALERPTRTLTSMLAKAGGVTIEPEITRITVIRDGRRGTIWLEDLYADPRNDIPLRPGDRILVEEDSRSFTAIGATGGQSRVTFETQTLSAIDAIAQVGGLSSNTADPTGIFILRDESAHVVSQITGHSGLKGDQRVAYIIDLTQPMGVFFARDFQIRDEDTIYVTEAPFVQWQKTISALTGTAGSVNSLSDLANGN